MNNRIRLDVEDRSLQSDGIEHIDVEDLYVAAIGKQRRIGGAHQENDLRTRVSRCEMLNDVVAQRS